MSNIDWLNLQRGVIAAEAHNQGDDDIYNGIENLHDEWSNSSPDDIKIESQSDFFVQRQCSQMAFSRQKQVTHSA